MPAILRYLPKQVLKVFSRLLNAGSYCTSNVQLVHRGCKRVRKRMEAEIEMDMGMDGSIQKLSIWYPRMNM